MTAGADPLAGLLAACARRDRAAFSRLYEATSAKLYGVAVRILRREDWADEALQECFVSIWTHAPDYRSGLAAPMAWMTNIVRNRCLDALEARQRQAIALAFYDGLSHAELALHLREPLGTVKTTSPRAARTCNCA